MTQKNETWLSETILELHRYAESQGHFETARYLRDAFFASYYERTEPQDEPQDDRIARVTEDFRRRWHVR